MSKFCPNCGSQVRDGVKFCDKCGTQMPAVANNQNNSNNSNLNVANYMAYKSSEKSMGVAILISFFLTGLGIVYAGNVEKGLIFFIGTFLTNLICLFIFPPVIFYIIALILWIAGLILTYNEVNEANIRNRMMFMNNN